jgi:hypothetical protein
MTRAVQIFGGYDPRMGKLTSMLDKHMQKHPFNIFNRMQSYLAAATGELAIRDWYRLANQPSHGKFRNWISRRNYGLRQLKKLNIDPRQPLTEEIMQQKMLRTAIDTQLLRDILKDPVHASDPRFRAFFLFQRFGYKQFRFFKNEVAAEILHGNPMPLVRAAILGYLGGEVVVWAKNRTREFIEALVSLATTGKYESIPRYRRDKVTDVKSAALHALNNYAAVGTMGFFTDVFRVNDPRQAETPADVAGFIKRNLAFAATPVLIREAFITPSEEMDYFIKRWRDRGIRAAVDQLEMAILRNISPLSRYAAGGLTKEDRDFVFEFRKAIEDDRGDLVWKISEIAGHRGLHSPTLFLEAMKQYKARETKKFKRDLRIMEYNAIMQRRKHNNRTFGGVMKKMIFLLLACLLLTNIGWGQATEFQRAIGLPDTIETTLDSTDTDTIHWQLPRNRGKAVFMAYVWMDDQDGDGSGAGNCTSATHDSILIQYRPAYGGALADTLTNSAGTGLTWTDLQIYNGPSGALTEAVYRTAVFTDINRLRGNK